MLRVTGLGDTGHYWGIWDIKWGQGISGFIIKEQRVKLGDLRAG